MFDVANGQKYRRADKERTLGLGERIRKTRERQALSLSEVARRARISKAYLSQLEHGESTQPSYEVLMRLSTALGETVSKLIGRTDAWSPAESEPLPRSLKAFAQRSHLPEVDVSMLAKIHFRGKQPESPEDWAHLYETIKRTIR